MEKTTERRTVTPKKRLIRGGNDNEHSPAASMSVFDRLRKKLIEQDLRHQLDTKSAHKDRAEGPQSRAPSSQRKEKPQSKAKSQEKDRRPLKEVSVHDNEESSGSHNNEEVNKDKGQAYNDDYEVALGGENEKLKTEELLEALKKVKADKKSKDEFTMKSSFTKRVRESPLPRIYRGYAI